MKPKKWAVFRADAFSDDTVETDEDIITFPGRNIAEALRPILDAAGCTDIGDPMDLMELGWEFTYRHDGKEFWSRISRIEPETLIVFEKVAERGGIFRRPPSRETQLADHERLLEKLHSALAADPRFAELSWYTASEMNTQDWSLSPHEPMDEP